jgi:asparagine synthase (glutamine-hydrolysing)
MTDAMAHRGPDATGFFSEGPIALGHLRLSIIDLSTSANQPFTDASGRYVMVFNGEIYNYNEVKALLAGYPFHTTSDTETLLAAYARWGEDCLRYLKGMFAFAIWDKQERSLFIARDRMGVKPLYYSISQDRLIFASEIRGILASGLVPRKLDHAALGDFLSYQSTGYPHTAIQGVVQLEAGSYARISEGAISRSVYWDVTRDSAAAAGFDLMDRRVVQKRIRELMLQSINRRLVSDVPVGAFLSGGIDSGAVVGLMAEAGASKPNTFTIAFDEEEFDESKYAEIVARKFGAHHTRITLKPASFLEELPNALDAMDTPSGDGINTYVVSKAIAGRGMRVALSGTGGDELFAGYPIFSQYLKLHRARPWWLIPPGIRRGLSQLAIRGDSGKRQRMRQLLQAPTCSIEDLYPILRQVLTPDFIHRTLTPATNGSRTDLSRELMRKEVTLSRMPLISQVSAAEYIGYTQHTLLKDTDQMSMAVSLEVREPFFDQDLVEFVLAVPDGLKKPSYPKSLLVESLKPLLPDEIVFRKKQGFVFPWNSWLKGELGGFCEGLIRNLADRSFVHGDQVIRLWQDFRRGDPTIRWLEIWLFVVLEYWMEKNNVD